MILLASLSCAWCTLLQWNVFSYDEQLNLVPQTFVEQILLDRHSATEIKRSIFLEMLSESLLFLFSRSAVFDSVRPCGLQHARLPCSSLSPRVCSDSCPLSQWCYLTISSSAIPFSFCLQTFSASGSFPMSWLFTSGGPKYWSFNFSINPSNIQGWFPLGLTSLISLQSKRLKSLLQENNLKVSILRAQPSLWFNSHIHLWLLEKP